MFRWIAAVLLAIPGPIIVGLLAHVLWTTDPSDPGRLFFVVTMLLGPLAGVLALVSTVGLWVSGWKRGAVFVPAVVSGAGAFTATSFWFLCWAGQAC